MDTHPECNNGIVALLIINPQRSIEPDKRESIQQDQVSLAKRNGSLIIETSILLRMFEQYCSGNLSREDCWSLISENTGELIM